MLGSTYALIAVGYSLIFGVMGLLHFAHGEVFMVGAFIALETVLLTQLRYSLSEIMTIIQSDSSLFRHLLF